MRDRVDARAGRFPRGRAGVIGLLLALVAGLLTAAGGPAAAQPAPVDVTGLVTSTYSGEPVAGGSLEFTVPAEGGGYTTVAYATTDPQGRYAVQVPVGRYDVRIIPPGLPYGPAVVLQADVAGAGVIDFALDDTAILLSGRVTGGGEPVPATVELRVKTATPTPATVASVRTDAEGAYRFPDYAADGSGDGSVYVHVSPDEGSGFLAEWYQDADGWQSAQQVATPRSEPLDFELAVPTPDDNTIRGRVTGDGDVVPATVALYRADSGGTPRPLGPSFTRTTDAQGDYELTGLARGTYYVQATPQQASDFTAGFFPDVLLLEDAQPVELTGASVAVADVPLPRTPVVGGLVTGPDAQPLAGVSVTLEGRYPPSGQMFEGGTVTTGADGRWQLAARPELEYRISFVLEGYRTQWYDGADRAEDATWVRPDDLGLDVQLARSGSQPTPAPWWRQLCDAPPRQPVWLRLLVRWACGLT